MFGDVGKSKAGSAAGKIWGIWVYPSLHYGTQHLPLAPSPSLSLHFPLFPHPFLAWALPPGTEQATMTSSCHSLGWFHWVFVRFQSL